MLANVLGPDGLIVIVAVVLVLLFGGAKLPKLARSIGSASHEFKKGVAEGGSDPASSELAHEAVPNISPIVVKEPVVVVKEPVPVVVEEPAVGRREN